MWQYHTARSRHRWALVIHACNPSYSGGRDQQDRGLKPAVGKWLTRPYLKNTQHKKGLEVWLKVEALSANPSTAKNK
jgi:hypothetical protein